ncbi:MAG: SH3 domain-containing protein [Turicibacter sp.]
MKKDKQMNQNHDKHDVPHSNFGEKIFTTVMSVALVAIIIFYVSLPIKALVYDRDKETQTELVDDTKPPLTDENVETPVEPPVVEEVTPVEPPVEEPVKEEEEVIVPPVVEEEIKDEPIIETPVEEDKQGKFAIVQREGLNVRTDTTSNSDAIGQASLGMELPILETYTEYTWVKVDFNGKEGFVHTDFIEIVER